jgi:plasmid replication initiation protein
MALLPDKFVGKDLFISDFGDITPKADKGTLEFSFFSLQKKKDTSIYRFEGKDGMYIEIIPSVVGRPTVWDQDLLMYAISQLVEARNKKEAISKTIVVQAHDFLMGTNRSTGGRSYTSLREMLVRLRGATFETNLRVGDIDATRGTSFISDYEIMRESKTGRVLQFSITLNDWFYEAVRQMDVLTIARDYFRITSGLERRLYQLARKHVGNQKSFRIGMETLYRKSGSSGTLRQFRSRIRALIGTNGGVLDYGMKEDGTNIIFENNRIGKKEG